MGWTVSCVLSPLSLDSLESTLCDQGEVCANPCPTGTYHVDCKRRCDCYNGAVCDHVTGKCHCLPGFKGAKVGSVCDHCTGCCDPSLSIKSDDVLCPVPGAVSIREIRPGLSAALPL